MPKTARKPKVEPYDSTECNQFVRDMTRAGIPVRHYRGRYFWTGPAVWTDEEGWPRMQDVHRASLVPMQHDNCAFDWIIYPQMPGKLIHREAMPDLDSKECDE